MKKIAILFSIMLFSYALTRAQATLQPTEELKKAILLLEPFQGNWTGEGWIQMGQAKHSFQQKETISLKVNNTILQIEGLGKDSETKEVVHQAYAIISYDAENSKYKMLAVRADGAVLYPEVTLQSAGNLDWSFTVANGGHIKFGVEIKDNKWVEKGMFSRDGINWMPFMEMNLTKEN